MILFSRHVHESHLAQRILCLVVNHDYALVLQHAYRSRLLQAKHHCSPCLGVPVLHTQRTRLAIFAANNINCHCRVNVNMRPYNTHDGAGRLLLHRLHPLEQR